MCTCRYIVFVCVCVCVHVCVHVCVCCVCVFVHVCMCMHIQYSVDYNSRSSDICRAKPTNDQTKAQMLRHHGRSRRCVIAVVS